jgi:hypothetical protein
MSARLFLLVSVCLFFALPAYSQRVVETDSHAVIQGKEAVLSLMVDSPSNMSAAAKVELLTSTDRVMTESPASVVALKKGKRAAEFRIPIDIILESDNDDIAWYRVRYQIGDSRGIISMSQLMPELFELRITAGSGLVAGMKYRVRIQALNPFNEKPATGVAVEAKLSLERVGDGVGPLELKGSGATDADGFAFVDFEIPPDIKMNGDGEIEVTGKKNGLVREADDDLQTLTEQIQFIAMVDKPIYQPGQLLNLRGILLKGGESKTVYSGSSVEFRVEDEDETLLYREKVLSSGFGVTAMSWRIPVNAKLGNYSIEIRDENGQRIDMQSVKVTRYDLPNFAVSAKPAKPYYLPADKEAEIEIRADYLFGKPVTKGKVRVVEENSREWNYKEQKYDIDEGDIREGETDTEGKFNAKFDLSEKHKTLADNEGDKYDDIKYVAYFTDLTTNKTEQRRLDVRITREPIHVYLIKGDKFDESGLPLIGYVSTFYADGKPAECDIEIKASEEDEDKFKTYARIKTNVFGAGKFVMTRPDIGDPDDDLDFRIQARDKDQRTGTFDNNISFNDNEGLIRVTTDHAIYKPGDTMMIKVQSTVKKAQVYVDIVSGWSVVDSRFAELRNGKAELQVTYNEKFTGELKVAAYIQDPDDDDDVISTSHGVIFPAKQGVDVDAAFDKAVYKPNDEATLKFGILDVAGKVIESALGVVIFDKAVEERARTDADFGGQFRGLSGWLGYGAGFGAFNIKDINELDLSRPISPELQLVAEIILNDSYYMPNMFNSDRYYDEAKSIFSYFIDKQFRPVEDALNKAYKDRNYLHAQDAAGLRHILQLYNVDLDAMRDPWGVAYKTSFSVNAGRDIVSIISAGPDKTFDTKDDFTAFTAGFEYFTPLGKAIDTAIKNYNTRTGDYIRDEKALLAELGLRELPDRYGRSYKFIFDGHGRNLRLRIVSSGPDGKFHEWVDYGDDFTVWTSSIDLFEGIERKISAVNAGVKKAPMTEAEFRANLKNGGVDIDQLRDGNGKPLYITVQQTSRYWDKITVESVRVFGETRKAERRIVTPVTQQIMRFDIRGPGDDGKPGTWDDNWILQYVYVLSEQSREDPKPKPVVQPIAFTRDTGAIAGSIVDSSGAAIPNATVTATNEVTALSRAVTTNEEGRFMIAQLPAGKYSVKAEAANFKSSVWTSVPITSGVTASITITMEVGGVSETVGVMSAAETTVEMSSSMVSSTVNGQRLTSLPLASRNAMQLIALKPGIAKNIKEDDGTSQQTSTPRVREYFPETLLWQPEVLTDATGRAEVKFRMADNITTWKMYTIASTKNGKIGFAEKEVAAFQAFFVDLDPPKFLTTGDEIFLPTQVRNYTEKKQNVNVTMSNADWFSFIGCDGTSSQMQKPAPEQGRNIQVSFTSSLPASCDANGMKQMTAVDSGQSENAVFGFKAVAPIKEGKQRVTAMAETDSDAIERPVTVRPDGREIVSTESRYFTGSDKIDINFPANVLPNTQNAELKIYPNLMAHVAESVEGLLRRPYGCGEQTISSTYPNLMILKFAGTSERRRIAEKIEQQARKNLLTGYERLLGYQVASGGFSYWGGKDEADLALTAYALRFLTDASAFIAVDPEAVKKAGDWLATQQRADGSWNKKYHWEKNEDEARAKRTTTYIARTLSMLAGTGRNASVNERASATPEGTLPNGSISARNDTLPKALKYLKFRNAEIDDPYSLALLGLAAFDAGDRALAEHVTQTLAKLSRDEHGGVYWNLESNTAFNGWGYTGRIETTALVTQLLIKLNSPEYQSQIGKAMIFLLKNKDRYGVWYSTQTTVNVLDTFVASLSADGGGESQTVEVVLNGKSVKTVEIGPDKLDQIIVELAGKLSGGANSVELKASNRSPLMAQLVSNHYIGWQDADSNGRTVNQSRALQLDYVCDRTDAAIMNEISCSVKAERIGYQGYGMLLAEIGTPPGADVSRESLEAAMEADWSISRYDILPDRIVLYMWSKAGGTNLNFRFKPRYGINAQTPPSTVYDYYNPEAQAVIAPLRFQVK